MQIRQFIVNPEWSKHSDEDDTVRNIRRNRKLVRKYGFAPKGSWMYRLGVAYKKILFEFNPYDDDDHPSVPHGDSYDHRYHLDLRDGTVYKGRDKVIGVLSRKSFNRLKQDKRLRELIVTAQAYYREHHPGVQFDPIPWCETVIMKHGAVIRMKRIAYVLEVRELKGRGKL